jgi:hypothetical protein
MPQTRNPQGQQGNQGDTPAKTTEDKATKFKRIAGKRTADAIAAIEKVGATTRPSTYEYTDEQAEKIVTALDDAVKAVRQSFADKGGTKASFDL